MTHVRCRGWVRYLVALIASVGCLLLRRALTPVVGDQNPYVILLAGPMVAAWFGGFGPGILAVFLTAIGADYLFVHPLRSIFGTGIVHDTGLVVFVIEGIFVSFLAETLHRTRMCAEESARRVLASDVRKDEFLATLGHELRNPLATVRHAVAILKDPRAREPQLARARETLERQADYMTRLIDDILDVSRITRGVLTFEMQRVDLRDAVAQAVEQCRTMIDGRRHEFVMTLPKQALLIDGDLVRLTQVVSNLIANAAKYTDEGGRISLHVEGDDREATISVRDNGMGIPPDVLPRVFELFTQSDRARSRSQGGLGLGLAVVRSIVERHRGSVMAISSGSGKGSEFTVRLPRPVTEEGKGKRKPARRKRDLLRSAVSSSSRARDGEKPSRRMLIVDDNVDVATSLATVLKLDGHDVRVATTGRMALEMARSMRPEIMLVDLRLPDSHGCDIVEQLTRQGCGWSPVLIALTGYWGEDVRQRCVEAGFHAFLLKPVQPAELIQTIEDCLTPAVVPPATRLSDASISLRGFDLQEAVDPPAR